jgi:hypothetical protein
MDQAIGILGQTILVLTAAVCVVWLLYFLLVALRRITQIMREISRV